MNKEFLDMQKLAGVISESEYNAKLMEDNSIELDGEIINVGNKISWINIALNQRRQGTVTDITDEGIFVTQDNRTNTKLLIKPPYGDKSISVLK